MALGAAVADAWMKLRVDDSEVSKDIKRGVDKADTGGAGERAGRRFTAGFGDGVNRSGGIGRALVSLTSSISGFGDITDAASKKSNIFARSVAGIMAATGIAEPAISALVVTTGAAGAAFAAGGVGLGAYGAALLPIMGRVKDLTTLQEQAAKGSKAAQEQLDKLLKTTPPAIVEFTKAVKGAHDEWEKWAFSLAKPVLTPLTHALTLVNPLLKDMTPFVTEAAGALDILVGKMSDAVRSTGFKEWLATMLPLVKPTIVGLGEAVGNIVAGLGNILQAFAPFSKGLINGIVEITQKFQDWSDGLEHHSGFQAMVSQWRTVWPEMRKSLLLLVDILYNILKAWSAMAAPGNTRALWLALNPILAVTAALSAHPLLVELFTYMYLASKVAGPLGALFTSLKSGWGSLSKFLGLVTGGRVQLGMQSSGDTMLLAARQMQIAADTMLAASKGGVGGVGGKAGKAAGAAEAGGAAAAGSRMSMLARGGVIAGGALLAAGIAQYWKDAWTAGLKGAWGTVAQKISQWLGGVPGVLQSGAAGIVSALSQKEGGLLGKIPIVGGGFQQIAAWFQQVHAWVNQFTAPARTWLSTAGHNVSQGFLDGIRSAWASVTGFFSGTPARILANVGNLAGVLINPGHAIIGGFINAARGVWNATVGPFFSSVASRAAGLVGGLGGTLAGAGSSLIGGLRNAAMGVWNGSVSPFLSSVASRASGLVGGLSGTLTGAGSSLISGLANGITNIWNSNVGPWLSGVAGRATGAVGGLGGTLVSNGLSLIQGLANGITQRWASTGQWLGGLGGRALAAVGNLGGALIGAGESLIQGLWNGMQATWNKVAGWLGSLKTAAGNLKGPESDDLQALVNNGTALIQGLWNGMQAHWPQVAGWLRSLTAAMQGGAGDASTLVSSGISIMQGLWNGLQQMWPQVSSWLGSLKNVIASVKGPESDDLTLLVDHGMAIMQGLLDGLKSGFSGGVQPYLEQVGGWFREAWQTIGGDAKSALSQIGGLVQQYLPQVKSLMAQVNKGGVWNLGGVSVSLPPGLLSGFSFAKGGTIPEPVIGLGARSGRRYRFHAGESVNPAPEQTAKLLLALIRAVQDNAAQTGAALADALNSTARSASYRNAYAVR
jgi:phage-related protein